MVYFLAFLVLVIVIVPVVNLSQISRLVLSGMLGLTLIFGAIATIQHRLLIGLVVTLAIAALTVDVISEFAPERNSPELQTVLKLACLSILVFMTLRKALRPGRVDGYRVIAGIAGYLLIGLTWTFAYQLVVNRVPDAVHFATGPLHGSVQQPSDLVYYSFVTLCTVGYGDAYPVHPIVRSLAVAEALVGQLYLAILVASLVGMALQTKSASEPAPPPQSSPTLPPADQTAALFAVSEKG